MWNGSPTARMRVLLKTPAAGQTLQIWPSTPVNSLSLCHFKLSLPSSASVWRGLSLLLQASGLHWSGGRLLYPSTLRKSSRLTNWIETDCCHPPLPPPPHASSFALLHTTKPRGPLDRRRGVHPQPKQSVRSRGNQHAHALRWDGWNANGWGLWLGVHRASLAGRDGLLSWCESAEQCLSSKLPTEKLNLKPCGCCNILNTIWSSYDVVIQGLINFVPVCFPHLYVQAKPYG